MWWTTSKRTADAFVFFSEDVLTGTVWQWTALVMRRLLEISLASALFGQSFVHLVCLWPILVGPKKTLTSFRFLPPLLNNQLNSS